MKVLYKYRKALVATVPVIAILAMVAGTTDKALGQTYGHAIVEYLSSAGGVLSGDIDMNGNDIILDAEGDNCITNDNNAIILFKVDGSNVLQLQSTVIYTFRDINFSNRGIKALGGVFDMTPDTIAADDTAPTVNAGVFFITSDNSGATAIADLTSPTAGQMLWICIGGTGANASTITDDGTVFNLSGNWTPGLDDCIQLYVVADNEYIELSRSDN